jgi:hypothetical protein
MFYFRVNPFDSTSPKDKKDKHCLFNDLLVKYVILLRFLKLDYYSNEFF